MNLGINTITAIGQQPAKILKSPHIESLCRRILVDGLKVARAEQIDFEDHIVDDILNIYKGYPDEMGTSMYYDVINKHPLKSRPYRVIYINVQKTSFRDTLSRYGLYIFIRLSP